MADRCANRKCAEQLDGTADEGELSLTLINGLELELELCPACVPLASAGLPLGGYGFSLALRPQQWSADYPGAVREAPARVLAAGGGQLVQDPRPSGYSADRVLSSAPMPLAAAVRPPELPLCWLVTGKVPAAIAESQANPYASVLYSDVDGKPDKLLLPLLDTYRTELEARPGKRLSGPTLFRSAHRRAGDHRIAAFR